MEQETCSSFLRSTWNIDLFFVAVELLVLTKNVPRGTFRRTTETAALAHFAQARLWDSESCQHSFFCSFLQALFPCRGFLMLKARVISVSNQKGGVGKTTTAVNLAACLAAAEYRVLLVDLDPQGNASSALGVDAREIKPSAYELLMQECEPTEAIVQTELQCLDLVPSNQDLIGAEIELVSAFGREQRLKCLLSSVSERYDFILIDCPPALGLLTVNALVASDSVLIPLQAEYFALEGLSQLLKTVDLVRKFLNKDLAIEGILLTMFDRRNNLCHQVAAEVVQHFESKVFDTRIPRNVKLGEAPSFGKPILLYDIQSPGAVAYLEATQELIRRTQRPKPMKKADGTDAEAP